jgi:ribonuclease D
MEHQMNKAYTILSTDNELKNFIGYLENHSLSVLAMDFEGEFNLHVYGETLCLIQIFDGASYFVVDPFRISSNVLAELLENRKIVKLFYDSVSDSMLVYKQYGIRMKAVYDIKIPVNLLDFDKKGLDAVILKLLGVEVFKKKRFQQYNWTKRPIAAEAMQYALGDVEHLFALKEILLNMIAKEGKTEDLIFALIKQQINFDKKFIPGIFKSFDFKKLPSTEKRVLKKIFYQREETAKKLNVPPNLVLDKKQLFRVAQDMSLVETIEFNRRIPLHVQKKFIQELKEL